MPSWYSPNLPAEHKAAPSGCEPWARRTTARGRPPNAPGVRKQLGALAKEQRARCWERLARRECVREARLVLAIRMQRLGGVPFEKAVHARLVLEERRVEDLRAA
eukprot:1969812-Prymnesium_polylepis.2